MDVSEAQSRDYPRILYPKGSSNLEGKDINHNFHIGEFHHVREAIGRDVWEELERSSIGVIAKLAGRKSVWSCKTVHYLLCRHLRVHKKEIWSLVGYQPIMFRLHEFGEITGLNTDPVPTKSFEPDQYKAFWEELNIPLGMGPNAKRVFDDEAMTSYPWGRTAYEVLVDSIKMLDPQGWSYTINGMKDVLLLWACESESVKEMFPQWLSEAEDPQLVNLITYIMQIDLLECGVSSEAESPTKNFICGPIVSLTSEEEGNGEMVNHALLVNIMSTLKNISRKFDHHEGRFETIESRLNANDSKWDMPNMNQQTIDDIVKAAMNERLKVLGSNTQQKSVNSPMIDKTPGMGLGTKKNLAEDFASVSAIPATGVKKNLTVDCASGAATPASDGATPGKADKEDALDFVYISPAKVDKAAKAAKAKDAKAQKDGKDEAVQALGRGCRGKPKDQDVLLKKEAAAKKRAEALLKRKEAAELKRKAAELKKQESIVKKEAELNKQKVTQIKKEKVVGTGTPPRANVIRVKFKNTSEQDSSLVEVTDEIRARENKLLPETTCMRKNFQPSSAIYDPLALVDPAKFEKLMQHIKEIPPKLLPAPTKKPPPRLADYEGDFYSILMKERPWPDTQYGWLFDNHVAAYMKVLIGRSMRDPTPFWSKRIAFIDPWFITLWVHDFKQFKINPNLMKFKGTGYEDLSKERIPFDLHTNLKWFEDVDHLYGVLQVSGDHWVAFHVDLKKEKIDCYNPIIGHVTEESETKMIFAFKPLSQMLPVMLIDIVPAKLRKPCKKQFAFRRRKGKYIRQNTQVGDCGVYSLKFIKCLVLGVTFDGINDENIQGLRVKMATYIHD
ncbi:hypothetical protein N665_0215s0003 [Sinapis alba]|nr:hypothetical protein N665_0215s0003 [Sinapis alba]